MADLPKLDTADAVLAWGFMCGRAGGAFCMSPDDNSSVAAYLAECVRVRQAFDDAERCKSLVPGILYPANIREWLRAAMNGNGDVLP